MVEHRSEQQERMELDSEPESMDSPAAWEALDQASAPDGEETAPQFSPPDGDTEIADEERTEIAQEHDAQPAAGPEQGAMHVTDDEAGDGRVWR